MANVTARGLAKKYGNVEIVHGIDFSIADGEFVVLVGESGSGKSTVLRMIAGLEDISQGEILVGDVVVNDLEPRDRGVAMVFQDYALYPHLRVRDNIGFALEVSGVSKHERMKRVEQIAELLQVQHLLDRYPRALSGGQRQRVAMGRALIRDPGLFLFDEPLSNLDAKLRTQMRAEIKRLHMRTGTTMVYVTHDQVEAMTLADRIICLRDGKIAQMGTPAELYGRPANAFVAGFIGSPPMNLLKARVNLSQNSLMVGDLSLPIPTHLRGSLKASEGRAVLVGIRPEHFSAVPLPEGRLLDLPVDIVEPLGADTLVHTVFGGELVVARVSPDAVQRGATSITLHIDPERIQLFDHATGDRIETLELQG